MCFLIQDNLAGFIVGVASSAVVSWIFYSKGKHDAKRQHTHSQMDSVRLALARCDPTQKGAGRRGDDGLEPTAHWLGCMIDVLQRTGSPKEADALRGLKAEMEQLIRDFEATPEDAIHRLKGKWQDTAAVL
ncbi:MAG: hypothetical protein JNG82_12770 [Opitutaceae bacterium]|nr:hypothetical protein [Opitutaceae bacterium]